MFICLEELQETAKNSIAEQRRNVVFLIKLIDLYTNIANFLEIFPKMRRINLLALILVIAGCSQNIPSVYDQENTGARFAAPEMKEFAELPEIKTLPDPFTFADGSKLKNFSQWEKRRSEIMAQIQHYEIGVKPATPKDCVTAELRHGEPKLPQFPGGFRMNIPLAKDTIVVSIKVNGETLDIHCPVIYPEGDGPFPAIIGIGFCAGAGSLPTDIFTKRNIAMIGFPFSEVMAHHQTRGNEPINKLYPELQEMGAYAAWPWGVSRVIDGLEYLGESSRIDMKHLAISGCSFAGKMALFAGAFDERIALTIAQEPGGGGAAAWRVSETLGEVETIARTDYTWFKESMRQFGLENSAKLPIDHHELCALVALRAKSGRNSAWQTGWVGLSGTATAIASCRKSSGRNWKPS